MKEQILLLCKRLNCFTLDKIETITELDRSEFLPILDELISENKLFENNGQYYYNTQNSVIKQNSIFKYYNAEKIDLIINLEKWKFLSGKKKYLKQNQEALCVI